MSCTAVQRHTTLTSRSRRSSAQDLWGCAERPTPGGTVAWRLLSTEKREDRDDDRKRTTSRCRDADRADPPWREARWLPRVRLVARRTVSTTRRGRDRE